MKRDKKIHVFIFILIGLVPLGYMATVLDNSLLPKFLGLSLLLIITTGYYTLRDRFTFRFSLIDYTLFAYFFCHSISVLWALNMGDAIYESLKVGLFIILLQILKSFLLSDKDGVYSSIALTSLFATFIAIALSMEELGSALRSKVPFNSSVYLIKSQFGHKNMLSNWLLFLLPLNLLGLKYHKSLPKILFQLVIVVQVLMIFLLMTRAVYLALFVGLILFILIRKRSVLSKNIITYTTYSVLLAVTIVALLSMFGKLPNLIEFDTQASSSSVERLVVWSKTLQMIKEEFWLGVGAGNWKILLPSQGVEGIRRAIEGVTVFARPHNDYLWVWSELGIFGFLSFLSFLVLTVQSGFKAIFQKENYALLLAFCGLISYLIVAFFDFPKERIESSIALAVFVSIIMIESLSNLKSVELSRSQHKIIGTTFICFTLFCIYFSQTRIESESHMRIAMEEKEKGNNQALITYAMKSEHLYFSADNNGMPVRYYSGIGHFNLNQKQNAIDDFKLAYELNPYNFNVVNNIATAFFISNDYVNAEKYYLKALEINPYFDDAKLNLAATYINTNQKDKANYYLNQVKVNSERLNNLKALAL